MYIGSAIFPITVGAILRWAVSWDSISAFSPPRERVERVRGAYGIDSDEKEERV